MLRAIIESQIKKKSSRSVNYILGYYERKITQTHTHTSKRVYPTQFRQKKLTDMNSFMFIFMIFK